jgi:hypothetical protein
MSGYITILTLENEIEKQVLASILDQEGIPYAVHSYYDSAYDGLWQAQNGWGRIEAPAQYKERILSLYRDMKKGKADGGSK